MSITYNGSAEIELNRFNWGYIDNKESDYYSVEARATSAVFDDKNAGTDKTIYPQTLTGEIKPLELTHNVDIPYSKVYDGTNTTTYTGGLTNVIEGDDLTLNAVFNYNSADVATANTVNVTTWNISGEDAGNYTLPDFSTHSAYITPAPQSIEFTPSTSLNLKDGSYTLEAVASSDLPVLFRLRSQDEEFASISGNILNLLKAGAIEVTAYVADNANYQTAPEVPVEIEITGGTGIDNIQANEAEIIGYYSFTGQKLSEEPESGLYIVLYDNGTSEKRIK